MQTVGEILKAEREKQGISVKDVEKGTSIRALYIQAIEDGNYKVLPGEVYLKGFVRNYASFLGLSPQEMMEVYRKSQEPLPPQPPTPAEKPRAERPREREAKSGGGSRWLIALVIILLVAGGAWAAMTYLNQPPEPVKPAPQAQVPRQAPAPVPAPTPAPSPAAPAPVAITAKYTDSCWTQVNADGQDIYTGIPRVGETLSWNAKQYITLRLGNAAGVDLTYNGQPQGRLGGDGDVISKTYGTAPSVVNPR